MGSVQSWLQHWFAFVRATDLMVGVRPVSTPTKSTLLQRDSVMVLGVGSFSQGVLSVLKERGCDVSTYLTRPYAHFGPRLVGTVFDSSSFPNPLKAFTEQRPNLIIPQSIDWAQQPWADDLLGSGIPFLCPRGEALLLERDREYTRQLCRKYGVPFPQSYFAPTLADALSILRSDRRGYVLKNPLCSPTSPIHTIVCETAEETEAWLPRLDYREGVFLQEFLGRAEIGHIALVSGGEIHSLISNQEYKRAFTGNMGIVAGAPLGGLVELDPGDRYGLAKTFLHPLLPWFRETNFHGPVQITAIQTPEGWSALEYNVRLGVTCGPVILELLKDPFHTLLGTARNEPLKVEFNSEKPFACSITLAGQGYPYTELVGPQFPVRVREGLDCRLLWNEVAGRSVDELYVTGHRVADVVARGTTLISSIESAYSNIRRLHCLGSYYRTDIGAPLTPQEFFPSRSHPHPECVGDTIPDFPLPLL